MGQLLPHAGSSMLCGKTHSSVGPCTYACNTPLRARILCMHAVGVLGADTTPEEARGLLDVLTQSLASVCNTLHAFTDGAGQTLKEELKQAASRLKDACVELARALVAANVANAVKPAVGDVWDQCESIKKTPMDNKTALFKKIAAVTRVLKDTLREVRDHSCGDPYHLVCAYRCSHMRMGWWWLGMQSEVRCSWRSGSVPVKRKAARVQTRGACA